MIMNKPSTKLGNAMGAAMRGTAWTFDYALPLAAIGTYQLIPGKARGQLLGGPSASTAAMRAILHTGSGGWEVIRGIAVSNHPPRPTS
jgi:hypothetical protein